MLGMISMAITLLAVFLLLLLAEYLRRKKHIKGELARKFVHMSVGTFVAFWPIYLTWDQIRILCLAFLVVVIIDRHLHVFKSVHSVKRRTVGDIFFPIGILVATYVSSSPWIFTAAILHLSIGDGMAAIIGNKFGKKYSYSILGQKKSWAGSIAFWMTSLVIISALITYLPDQLAIVAAPLLVLMPVSAALLESISIFGIDNVTVPVFVALILSVLQRVS